MSDHGQEVCITCGAFFEEGYGQTCGRCTERYGLTAPQPEPRSYAGLADRLQALNDNRVSVICPDFHGVNWYEKVRYFPVFTVYENPSDFPGKYAVRLFDGDKPTRLLVVKDTLEEARSAIPKMFYGVKRSETDDPKILETYI